MKSQCSTLSFGLCFSSFFLDFCVVVDADLVVVVPVVVLGVLLLAVRFATAADAFLLPVTAARSKIPLLKAE